MENMTKDLWIERLTNIFTATFMCGLLFVIGEGFSALTGRNLTMAPFVIASFIAAYN